MNRGVDVFVVNDLANITRNWDVTQIDSPFLSERTNALAVLGDTFADSSLFAHVTLRRGERSAVADLAAERL